MKPTTNNLNPKALDSSDMLVMGLEFSQKPGVDLIRNCDLPPPQKVFRRSDAGAAMGRVGEGGGMEEKMEVLKALRLSQTRAREAERKAAKLMEERDCMRKAFEEEARLKFCYGQWVRLMELQIRVSKLKLQKREEEDDVSSAGKEEEEDDGVGGGGGGGLKWVWAFAICFSVVGLGFLLGYTSNLHDDPILIDS